MVKVIAAVAVLAAVAATGDATYGSYKQLKNPLLGKCLISGRYVSYDDQYQLKLQSCSSSKTQYFKYTGGKLINPDGYCVTSIGDRVGSVLVLDSNCYGPYAQWQRLSGNAWRNRGSRMCMDAVISSGAMVQKPCSQYYVNTQQYVLSGGSSPTPYPPKPPTPPPKPTYQSCNDWGSYNSCPYGYQLNGYATCSTGYNNNCKTQCCTPKPQPPQRTTCATWSGSCAYGQDLIPQPWKVQCKPSGYDNRCKDVCCLSPPPPPPPQPKTTCATWSGSCGYGGENTYSNTACNNGYGSPKCSSVCCKAVATSPTCESWFDSGNSCGYGVPKPDGTTCSYRCSRAQCCSSSPPPPPPPSESKVYCQDGPYQCQGDGWTLKSSNPVCPNGNCNDDVCCDSPPSPPPPGDGGDNGGDNGGDDNGGDTGNGGDSNTQSCIDWARTIISTDTNSDDASAISDVCAAVSDGGNTLTPADGWESGSCSINDDSDCKSKCCQ